MVIPLRTPPTLFDKIEFRMELGEEQYVEAVFPTVFLEERSDALEVRLGVKCSANTTISAAGRATEARTFPFQIASLITEPTLFENYFHPFKEASAFMAVGEVERVGSPICKGPGGHLNLLCQLLPVGSVELFSRLIEGGSLD